VIADPRVEAWATLIRALVMQYGADINALTPQTQTALDTLTQAYKQLPRLSARPSPADRQLRVARAKIARFEGMLAAEGLTATLQGHSRMTTRMTRNLAVLSYYRHSPPPPTPP